MIGFPRQFKGASFLLSTGLVLAGLCLTSCDKEPRYQLVQSALTGAYRLDRKSGEVVWIIRDRMYRVPDSAEKDTRVQRASKLDFTPVSAERTAGGSGN